MDWPNPPGGSASAIAPASDGFTKFENPAVTAMGEPRARVCFQGLETLWLNTGTLCNVECIHCYIESSPTNDRLSYLTADEAAPFIEEAAAMGAREIGFTGGEPFLNPDFLTMLERALEGGCEALVLTNAMRPMMRPKTKAGLIALNKKYPGKLKLRVSLDHYGQTLHDEERGEGSFTAGVEGLCWLKDNRFEISVAGRTLWGESPAEMRAGFAALFAQLDMALDAANPAELVLFPEMDEGADVPEITESCWSLLGKRPEDVMCASARMVVKRKGSNAPVVLACTLIPYDRQFEMGASLAEAARPVKLNHPHCAKFCVLGGASCSG